MTFVKMYFDESKKEMTEQEEEEEEDSWPINTIHYHP